jgi:DNA-binding XRE family transcriptional regulator
MRYFYLILIAFSISSCVSKIQRKNHKIYGCTMEQTPWLKWDDFVKEAINRRKEQRMTQEQLAKICGMSKPTLCDFEKGRRTITLANAFKILYMLGLMEKDE